MYDYEKTIGIQNEKISGFNEKMEIMKDLVVEKKKNIGMMTKYIALLEKNN